MKEQTKEMKAQRPDCWNPEIDVAYPLCVGNGSLRCNECALFKDFEPECEW